MKHKNLVRIAIVMVIVFGLIVVVYPRLFAPKYPTSSEALPPTSPTVAPVDKM